MSPKACENHPSGAVVLNTFQPPNQVARKLSSPRHPTLVKDLQCRRLLREHRPFFTSYHSNRLALETIFTRQNGVPRRRHRHRHAEGHCQGLSGHIFNRRTARGLQEAQRACRSIHHQVCEHLNRSKARLQLLTARRQGTSRGLSISQYRTGPRVSSEARSSSLS